MNQSPATAVPTKFAIWEEERWTVDETADFYAVHNGDFTIATLDFVRWRPEQAKAYANLIAGAPETAAERDRLVAVNKRLVKALETAKAALGYYIPTYNHPQTQASHEEICATLDEARKR